jgi:hypothetical protein
MVMRSKWRFDLFKLEFIFPKLNKQKINDIIIKYHQVIIKRNRTLFLISNVLLQYLVQGTKDNSTLGLKP